MAEPVQRDKVTGRTNRDKTLLRSLPRETAVQVRRDRSCVPQQLSSSGAGYRCVHVLVVDDYPDIVDSMALLLRLHGHEVDTALDGRTAITQALETKPDVALLDISMPEMDGYEVARQLRELFHEDIILIAVTANGFEEDKQRAIEAGFNQYLIKPADPTKLTDILRDLAKCA
jgi:CheY-like chemotaxis protein